MTDINDVRSMLDRYMNLSDAIEALRLDREAIIDSLIPDEVKKEIADVEFEYSLTIADAEERKRELEKEIKDAIKSVGVSVSTDRVRATLVKPKPSWDGKKLLGYAAAHPEIKTFMKEREPYVQLKRK